jgi:hypothetical protein
MVVDGSNSQHHRQETCSVKIPPRSGPMTLATIIPRPINPRNAGLCRGAALKPMIAYPPLVTPAPPRPAIALPTINMVELVATPQIKLPSSKQKIAKKYIIFRSQN